MGATGASVAPDSLIPFDSSGAVLANAASGPIQPAASGSLGAAEAKAEAIPAAVAATGESALAAEAEVEAETEAETLESQRPRRKIDLSQRIIEPTYFNLFWIFVIACVVGLVVETLVARPLDGVWKDRAGLLWGPFSPIYGVGALLMTVVLNRFATVPAIITFAVATVLGGGFELVVGWGLKHFFGIVAWSYIDQPFNIGGYTCLSVSLWWGVLGLAWVKLLLPWLAKLLSRVPQKARALPTVLMSAFMAVDIVMTLLAFNCWYERSAGEPIETPVQEYFAENYGDDFMEDRFETMSLWAEIASR